MVNTKRLRCMIGFLGMGLALIVLVLSAMCYFGAFQDCALHNYMRQNVGHFWPDSISCTWYCPQCVTPFMIILGAASILLMFYDGYDKTDDIINTIGSIFGLGICLFPCKYFSEIAPAYVGTFSIPPTISGRMHNLCALGFFLILALNSLFQFTKSSGIMTQNKRKRNIIYKACGIVMLASLAVVPVISIIEAVTQIRCWGVVWFVQMIALFAFGISWITKANAFKCFFAD